MPGSKKNLSQRALVAALNEHLTPAEIAVRLGISRQRVYQILSDEPTADYLTLNKQHRRNRTISRNLARSLGPASVAVDRATRGAMSELIAAADLMALGWKPYVPLIRNRGYDLIATKAEHTVAIEVRSAMRRDDAAISASRKKLPHPSHYFAFVLPDEPVVYHPPLPTRQESASIPEKISRGPDHSEATVAGLKKSRAEGRVGGRRQMFTEEQIREALALRHAGKSWLSAAKAIGISVTRLQARVRQLCPTN